MSLLLQPVNFLLTRADELIALTDLRVEVVGLLLQVSVDLVLTVDEDALLLDLTLQVANLSKDLNQLVLRQLQFCLRLQAHVLYMHLICTIFLIDIIHLELCVHMNLLYRLFILTSDCLNLLVAVVDLVQLLFHVCLVRLFLCLHLLLVLPPLHVHLLLE